MKKLAIFLVSFIISSLALSSVHAQDKPAEPPFHPYGVVSGQLFADYYYIMSADTTKLGGKGYYEPNANISASANTRYYQAFDLRRAQLGYTYWFSKDITGKVLLEHENGAAANGDVMLDAKRGLYLKEANVAFGNAIPMGTVIFGQQATNVFSVDEGLLGYRSIEKSIVDRDGMSEAGSNDLGIQLVGNIDNDKNFGYSAMISNGNGAKDETDKYKAFTGEINAKFMDKHIVLDVAGDYMDKANIPVVIIGKDTAHEAINVTQSNSLIKIAAAYTSSQITVGVVYAMHNLNGQSKSVAGNDAVQTGLSIFAHGTIIEKQLRAFARFDMFDPDKNASDNSSGRKETFFTAGLDWMPDATAQNVHVEPNVWINTFKDKSSANLSYEGIVVPRLTFAYKF
jgi:hypothetical protein